MHSLTRQSPASPPALPFSRITDRWHLLFAALLTTCCLVLGWVALVAPAMAGDLVDFASDEGLARLARSTAKVDFAPLGNQFEGQSNGLFCGPTSAAIVLNALAGRQGSLPRDRSRLQAGDLRHLPAGADPTLPRFTPESVIETSSRSGGKTRAQVFGEPMSIGQRQRSDFGYQLRQLDQLLRGNGARSQLVVVSDTLDEERIRTDLIDNLQRPGDYVVVNYLRKAVGQHGGGHISPLGAYDAASDSFLVLDVNPAAAGWVWMPASTLIAGMRTFDTLENRGYLLLESR